jgi:hypothetical protein
MTISTIGQERIGLPPVQVRAELRIDEALRLDNIRGLAGTHSCPALRHIEELRTLHRANTPAFTAEMPRGGLYDRLATRQSDPRPQWLRRMRVQGLPVVDHTADVRSVA